MFAAAKLRGLGGAIGSTTSISLPIFLLPAFSVSASRSFSASANRPSQIGRAPLSIPPEVKFEVLPPVVKTGKQANVAAGPTVKLEGPLGTLTLETLPFVNIKHDPDARTAFITVEDAEIKRQREMWGTTRANLQNYILGVSEGHTAILRLVGVGYRATIEDTATTVKPQFEGQKFVSLKVGYSHPIELPVPKGIKASVPQPTRILLEGVDKMALMSFAAEIRMWRKPEPYKGKGIFVNGETIKLKSKKIK